MKPIEIEREDGGVDFKRGDCQRICATTNAQGMGVVRCPHCYVGSIKGITELACDKEKDIEHT